MAVQASIPFDSKTGELAAKINFSPYVQIRAKGSLGVVLTHGAGGDMDTGYLPQYAEAISMLGIPCIRFTHKPVSLPSRVKAMQAVMEAAPSLHPSFKGVQYWITAGHSMGARVAATVAAEQPEVVVGCLFSSYPVHSPGKETQLRDVPLKHLVQPLLFLRGTKDTFSTPGPWERLRGQLESEAVVVNTIDGGNHGLQAPGGKAAQGPIWESIKVDLEGFIQHKVLPVVEGVGQHGGSSHRPKQGQQQRGGRKGGTASNKGVAAASVGAGRGPRAKVATKGMAAEEKQQGQDEQQARGADEQRAAAAAPQPRAQKPKKKQRLKE